MIKTLLILVLLLSTSAINAQEWKEIEANKKSKNNLQVQLVTYYYDYDSTKIRARGHLSATGFSDLSKKIGEWVYYDESGNIQEKSEYVRGYAHGRVVQYYPNGQKKNMGYFYWNLQDSLKSI